MAAAVVISSGRGLRIEAHGNQPKKSIPALYISCYNSL